MEPERSALRGRPEAARVIWSWRRDDPAVVDDTSLRRTGLVRGLVGLAVAALFLLFAHLALAILVGLVGTVTLAAALISPRRGYGAIHRSGERLGLWLGRAIGFVMLPLVFYLVITPLALLFRLQGRDVLARRTPAGSTTYWSRRNDAVRDDDFYRRQS